MLPFLLKPYYKTVIWGGRSIKAFKGCEVGSERLGESWEVSAMPGCESVVATGALEGLSLSDVCRRFGAELLGEELYGRTGGEFPLLIKYIDATDDLSVQVHPGDELARSRHSSHGKSEMWYIVDAKPGARLSPGLKEVLTPDDFRRRVADGTFIDAMAWYETAPGDLFYVPAGRVHAIGAGNLLVEVQQPSDITYRVYDYGRRDSDGRLRQLRIDDAIDAIDYDVCDDYRIYAEGTQLIETRHFKVEHHSLNNTDSITVGCDTFAVVMCIAGATIAVCGEQSTEIARGHTMIVPAGQRVELRGPSSVLVVYP